MAKEPQSAPGARTSSARLEQEERLRSEPKRNKTVLLLGIFIVVVVIGASFAIGRFTAPSLSTVNETTTSKVAKSVTGESVETDQKNAMSAAQALLSSSATDGDYQARMSKIESGDFSSIPDEMQKAVHLSDSMDSEGARSSTYQSLVALNALMIKGEAKPTSPDAVSAIQIDSENGIAYVPLGVFTGSDVPFSFEMVFVDGEWKLAPYSLLQSIQMSSAINTDAKPAN